MGNPPRVLPSGKGGAVQHGKPEIFNTDQGSQFTSTDFNKVLAAQDIKISMECEGAWRENVFVERLWRTIKYEKVYLHAYASVPEARASMTPAACIHRLTQEPPIRPNSNSRCPKRQQHNQGGNHLKTSEPVQTNRTTSLHMETR